MERQIDLVVVGGCGHVGLPLAIDPGFEHDVKKRVPAIGKAKKVLGFEALTSLDEMLDEVVPWIEKAIKEGKI
jgi:UDP-glucose 4-epimerase